MPPSIRNFHLWLTMKNDIFTFGIPTSAARRKYLNVMRHPMNDTTNIQHSDKMQYEIDLQSEHKKLFLEAIEFLLSFEGIEETKKKRITTYSDKNGGICHMRTMTYGIDFGFLKGAKMKDKLGLLTGDGKAIRV